MKEELLKNLAGIIDYVKQGADFVSEQAPLFIQEFITYKIWFYSFWIIMSVVISIICAFIFRKGYKLSQDNNSYNDELYCVMMFISGFMILTMFIVLCCCSEALIKVYFAPRYFLVDQLLSLGK